MQGRKKSIKKSIKRKGNVRREYNDWFSPLIIRQ